MPIVMSLTNKYGATLVVATLLGACGGTGSPVAQPTTATHSPEKVKPVEPRKPAPVVSQPALYELAVIYVKPPSPPLKSVLMDIMKRYPHIYRAAKPGERSPLNVRMTTAEKYGAPTAEHIKFMSRGLTEEQKTGAPTARQIFVLRFWSSIATVKRVNADALAIVGELAKRTGGVAWDDTTWQAMGHDEWAKRIAGAREADPYMASQISISNVDQGGSRLLRTRGMVRFGLPDLVVSPVSPKRVKIIGKMLNTCAQLLIEGAQLEADWTMKVSASRLRNPKARRVVRAGFETVLRFSEAGQPPGKSRNRLWRIEVVSARRTR